MKKKLCALAAAVLLTAAGGMADAQDLKIPGLGTFPFGQEISITDGSDSRVGDWIKNSVKTKGYGNTKQAVIDNFLYVPPGMKLFPGDPPYPYDSLRIYQIRKDMVQGDYTATIYVISGTEAELFAKAPKAAVRFWREAFREDAARPTSLFGMPKIRAEEFQADLDEAIAGKKGNTESIRLLALDGWRPVENDDGSFRWQQEIRGIMTNSRGLSFPFWGQSVLYRNGENYYLMEFRGSHAAAQALEKDLLYALYRLEREKA